MLDWQLPYAKWFVGGKLNISVNCLDRHVANGLGDKVAYYWEGEPGDTRTLTYQNLLDETCRMANALRSLGINKGDRVAIYMPMIPELAIAMLACARIGAPHSVVFGGFSADALSGRIDDAQCQPRHRTPQEGELTCRRARARHRAVVGFEHVAIDAIHAKPSHRLRKRASDDELGHTERGIDRSRTKTVRHRRIDETPNRSAVDRLGSIQRDAHRREIEWLAASQRSRRQHPREVGTGRRRTAVGRHPPHPTRGITEELLGRSEHQFDAVGHRQDKKPHQAHVVIEG